MTEILLGFDARERHTVLPDDYRFQFLLKAPRRAQLTRALAAGLDFCARKQIPESAVIVDVDPVSLF